MKHVLHIDATVQIGHDTQSRASYRRKLDGKKTHDQIFAKQVLPG